MAKQVRMVMLRATPELVAWIDRVTARRQRRDRIARITKADVLRDAVRRGLAAIEAELERED